MDPEALLNLTFSPQLESALAEVLPSDDPLDAADFDPVAYMNAKFPTEESLGSIDAFYDELDARSKSLNEEILQTVRAQTSAGSSARTTAPTAPAASSAPPPPPPRVSAPPRTSSRPRRRRRSGRGRGARWFVFLP